MSLCALLFVFLGSLCGLALHSPQGYGPDTVINFSGYIGVHNNERHLFYWFFESRKDPDNDPFIIWLTGGPGCSSMLALMVENGPYHVLDNETLEINNFSWNTQANVMWIDQPAGTGYSYDDNEDADGVYTEDEIAEDLYEFMQKFFSQHSKYSKLDFYVTGESYAGHYVPHFSRKIFDANKNLGPNDIEIPLKGLAIGDGLVDPYLQYDEYAPYARDYNLVDQAQYDIMVGFLPLCEAEIYYCEINDSLAYVACINAYDMCNLAELEPVTSTGVNPYDVREKCEYKPLCYNFDNVDTFYQDPNTVAALNASSDHEWEECNRIVESRLVFAGDWMKNYNVCFFFFFLFLFCVFLTVFILALFVFFSYFILRINNNVSLVFLYCYWCFYGFFIVDYALFFYLFVFFFFFFYVFTLMLFRMIFLKC